MKRTVKYTFPFALIISVLVVFAYTGNDNGFSDNSFSFINPPSPDPNPEPQAPSSPTAAVQDSTVRYAVQKTQITSYEDLDKTYPIDLQMPSNIKSEVEYDAENKVYLFKTKIGEADWVTILTMTPKEYNEYLINKSMSSYFKDQYTKEREAGGEKQEFSLKDIKVNLGALDRIFGPGGVRIRPNGYLELSMGLRNTKTENPTISPQYRSHTIFDFDQKIELNVKASVGDKINFDLNYNTQAAFDFDSKRLKLAYEGKEDEILKRLEAGNVSMSTSNSLIQGGASLFGIRADLQFGKLKINTVLSQQESQSQTVSSKGGVQTAPFEFTADQYEENKHFFLGRYFYQNYDEAMESVPTLKSAVHIDAIEVWVTNKRGNFDQARDIVAFADLAEEKKIGRQGKWILSGMPYPDNNANNLYSTMRNNYPGIRDISKVSAILEGEGLESGQDYEKVEKARLLTKNDYSYNPKTGYLSLKNTLQPDEVLAVAYQYKADGKLYKVGELSANVPTQTDTLNQTTPSGALILKLLKPIGLSPNSFTWTLMMKNVYSLGAYQLQKDRFRMNITYQSDTTGTYVNFIPEGDIKDKQLLKVMGLDRVNSRENPHPDGIFDYLEGLTVNSANGQIIFPVAEPFGKHLAKMINDSLIAKKYAYTELYDSTLTVARQVAEKNKFKMSGQYRASSSSQINLNATNVARGSVVVTAAGERLVEGVHYTVDYISGIVTIIDESKSKSDIQVSLENQALFSMQKKTMMGLNLTYDFSKNFTVGATLMHMYEKPLTTKMSVGEESLKNTLWGLNTSFRSSSQWLTNLVDKLPFYNATAPSQITFMGEFAQMIPGHYENRYSGGYSFIDDFETAKSKVDVREPRAWSLASTPYQRGGGLFPEAGLTNNIEYGKNRAHLSWFIVDQNVFLRNNSSLTPPHLKGDKDQLSNHFVREIMIGEIYPNRELLYNETGTLLPFNLSYYPEERGAYNIYPASINPNTGKMDKPLKAWGGIQRKLEVKDFEASNVEYIEFWLMDPFVYDRDSVGLLPAGQKLGGDLYFNLGEVSEDLLKDGKKFYENGMPINGDESLLDITEWGRVPKRPSTTYAFEESTAGQNARSLQDVGYDGLTTDQEKGFGNYKTFLDYLKSTLNPSILTAWANDPFSPLNDPAGDNYHYYRGADYDDQAVSILNRYKRFNGSEGNSTTDQYSAERTSPNVEDTNSDYTMSETEAYFQYRVSVTPDSLLVGKNYIVDSRTLEVPLVNGKRDSITWYQFKIPIREGEKIGNIRDFRSIRFMRMFLTNFNRAAFLRFATLDLVRGDWRAYTNNIRGNNEAMSPGTLAISTVNIEENGDKQPVNYIMPPGVTRIVDPSQPQIRQENEQAMSMRIEGLGASDARAMYKNVNYDLNRFKRLQMFAHAEELIGGTPVKKDEMTVFLRLGSDYKNNFYEYEIPLVITPQGQYSVNNPSDREKVWPQENMFDFPLEILKNLKLSRNKKKRQEGSRVSFDSLYHEYDPAKPTNRISIMGNPSLAEVKVLMIGVRNRTRFDKSAEVWVNELRLTDYDEEGGWAAQGNMNLTLSDLAVINLSGRKETAGFGALDQGLTKRRSDDLTSYSVAATMDLGKLLPEQAKISIPFYYAYSNQATTPKYNPLDGDVTVSESLDLVDTKAEKDSIRNLVQDKMVNKTVSVSNARINIRSKAPMPYDPANLNFSYSYNESRISNPTTTYDRLEDYNFKVGYAYSPVVKPIEPFKKSKSKAPMSKFIKALSFSYLPNNITFNSNITRNYGETLLRDLENYAVGGSGSQNQSLTWSQEFYWDRDFALSWDFTRNLRFSFNSGTKAEIEEPLRQVNKDLNRGDYEIWRDSVIQSLKGWGTPLSYRQGAKLTYTLPFATLPFADWITATADYDAKYDWARGAQSSIQGYNPGNNIRNEAVLSLDGRFNLTNLYNKWSFLKKTNQKFDGTSSSTRRPPTGGPPTKPAERKKFEKEIKLTADTMVIKHNLNVKHIRLTARRSNGQAVPIKYVKIDNNTVKLTGLKDTTTLKLSVLQAPDPGESQFYKVAQYAARGLMSVRSVQVKYSRQRQNYIYGFTPMVGDAFGQTTHSGQGMLPGLGFAFGFEGGEKYVENLYEQGLLAGNSQYNVSPAVLGRSETLDLRAQLEPIKGLKIDFTGMYQDNNDTELMFMYPGMPRNMGGSFVMTTVGLSSGLGGGSAANGYFSEVFDKFLAYRQTIANRLNTHYDLLPSQGQPLRTIGNNSSDVLIPAFLAAYTGQDPNRVKLSAFPSISSIRPNWTLSYDGVLNLLPSLKKKLKSLRISHNYTCRYTVGTYNSFVGWQQIEGDYGYIPHPLFTANGTADLLRTSPYNIASVSLTEAFNPLFGAEGTLNNSMTLRTRFNNSRTLSLNTASYQLIETFRNEFVLGMSYKIAQFNKVLGIKDRSIKGFSNDLNLSGDVSYSKNQSLIRRIEEGYSQATSGTTSFSIKLSADYALSRALTVKAFFDRLANSPLMSAGSYPTTTTNFGLSLRFNLTQ